HSLPTRRSSDLSRRGRPAGELPTAGHEEHLRRRGLRRPPARGRPRLARRARSRPRRPRALRGAGGPRRARRRPGPACAPGRRSGTTRRAALLLAPRQGLQPLRDGAPRSGARARASRDEREPPVAHGRRGMSAPAWVAVGTLVVVVVWLGLALVGAVRELGTLRGRLDALEAAGAPTTHLEAGLAVGAPAPAWTIATPGGGVASRRSFECPPRAL